MKKLLLLLCAAASLAVTSCQTTGDPSQGGLFGWSENKARGRQQALTQHLNYVEGNNAAQRERTAELEARKRQLENQQ